MSLEGAASEIERTVVGWSGVQAQDHRMGGREFRLGDAEIGHVHGDEIVDVKLPKALRVELIADGRADPHRSQGNSVSVPLLDPPSLIRAIALLRTSYEHHLRKPAAAPQAPPTLVRRLRRRLAGVLGRR